jgi:phage tail-like protein
LADQITDDDRGQGPFVTFAGAGFGTIQIERAVGTDPAPAAVSGRRYLRDNLPGIYSEGDFGMRFVAALEALLDPLMATLDNLPEHFDPVYAPRDVLDLLTAWLGLEHDEARSGEERRQIVRMAPELMRRRGTKQGLELALGVAFPGVPFRVQDGGSVTWSVELSEPEPSEPPAFVVYCDVPLSAPRLAAVARLIEQAKPAHVSYRLRVKAPNPHERSDA